MQNKDHHWTYGYCEHYLFRYCHNTNLIEAMTLENRYKNKWSPVFSLCSSEKDVIENLDTLKDISYYPIMAKQMFSEEYIEMLTKTLNARFVDCPYTEEEFLELKNK